MGSEPDLRRLHLADEVDRPFVRPPPFVRRQPLMGPPPPNRPFIDRAHFNQRATVKVPKPANFVHTNNFSRFCERFKQYVTLGRLQGPNLHYLFLSMLDDITYAKLERVNLRELEKRDPDLFCRRYERVIYPPGESKALRSELSMIKQGANESVEKFAFRISETAAKAYDRAAMRDEASYTAFIQGINDIAIKTKVHESDVDNFENAVALAERLERVAKSLNATHVDPSPIFSVDSAPSGETLNISSGESPRTDNHRPLHLLGHGSRENTYRPPQERQHNAGRGGRRNQLRCYYCGRENHVMRNCYRLNDDLNNGNSLQELIDRTNNRRQNRLNGNRAGQRNPAENRSE